MAPTPSLHRKKRSYATEADPLPAKPPTVFQSFTQPHQTVAVGQEYWARAAAAPKPSLADFKPTRKALLELTIADNASPLVADINKPIPVELHAMVEELMEGEWPVSTALSVGIYLDALCRRERVCRREWLRVTTQLARAKLDRAADPWFNRIEPGNVELPEMARYRTEREDSWQKARDIFLSILDQHFIHVPHRYIGSYLASCGHRGDIEAASAAFRYAGRHGREPPILFHFFLLQAYSNANDYAGAHAVYEAFIQARLRLRENGIEETRSADVQTVTLRYNTRRYRIGTTYVGESISTIEDAAAAMGALMIKTAFEAGHHYHANRLFHAMIRKDDLAPPIRACVILEYYLGSLNKRTEKETMKTLEWIREKPELRKALCASPYNYRAMIRTITDQEPRKPAALAHAYRCLMIDSKELAFTHFTSELHLTLDALVAAAVEPNRVGDWSVHILKDCCNIASETRLDEAEGRLVAETSTTDKWFRLSTNGTYRLVGALALFGMHTQAVEVYRELVKAATPGLKHNRAGIVGKVDVEKIYEVADGPWLNGKGFAYSTPSYSTTGNAAVQLHRHGLHTQPVDSRDHPLRQRPPHAFLLMGVHALGERVIGADPSLLNIIEVWRAQERLRSPKATQFMATRAILLAEKHPDTLAALPPKQRGSYKRLVKALRSAKNYPTRIVTRSKRAFKKLMTAGEDSSAFSPRAPLRRGMVIRDREA